MIFVTFVTCVNDFDKYDDCVKNSLSLGNDSSKFELIAINNSSNQYSIPEALNKGIEKARGNIIVCCHQDVYFPRGWISTLFDQIGIVDKISKNWGVLGTFGINSTGLPVGNIIDQGISYIGGGLPCEIQSLDEHCLIIDPKRGLRFDEELGGFHLYGVDICLQARVNGLNNYAIDACLHHRCEGKKLDKSFYDSTERLYEKWKEKKNPLTVIETTCTVIRLKPGLISWLLYKFIRRRRRHIGRKMKELRKKHQAT